jgi:hypothetical protein
VIQTQVADVDVCELSGSEMITEVRHGHEERFAVLAVIWRGRADLLATRCDCRPSTSRRSARRPSRRDDLDLAGIPGLFDQLPPCCYRGFLTFLDSTTWQLVEHPAGTGPELPGKHNLLRGSYGNDSNGIAAHLNSPLNPRPVRQQVLARTHGNVPIGPRSLAQ